MGLAREIGNWKSEKTLNSANVPASFSTKANGHASNQVLKR
jgi:hypothetical protein